MLLLVHCQLPVASSVFGQPLRRRECSDAAANHPGVIGSASGPSSRMGRGEMAVPWFGSSMRSGMLVCYGRRRRRPRAPRTSPSRKRHVSRRLPSLESGGNPPASHLAQMLEAKGLQLREKVRAAIIAIGRRGEDAPAPPTCAWKRRFTVELHGGSSGADQVAWVVARMKGGHPVSDRSLWVKGVNQPSVSSDRQSRRSAPQASRRTS